MKNKAYAHHIQQLEPIAITNHILPIMRSGTSAKSFFLEVGNPESKTSKAVIEQRSSRNILKGIAIGTTG